MPLPHNSATAQIIMDGLAIDCFNRKRQLWEVAFLRHNHHNHELKLNVQGYPKMPITLPQKRGITIRIETLQGISPYQDFPDGFFDKGAVQRKVAPADADQAENFRWIIDLENSTDIGHGPGHFEKCPFPVTRAFIENAVFYTLKLPTNDLHRLFDSEDGATMSSSEFNQRLFGKTNDLVGADITCAANGAINIVIDDDGRSQTIGPLAHRPGNPWLISLTNMRPTATESGSDDKPKKGDFQLYYAVFTLDDQRQKRALWGFPEPLIDDGFKISGRTDCNKVFAGTSPNLDTLF